MERYNQFDKVKTIDTWNNGMGKVIPKGSIVKIIYDNGKTGCMCNYNGEGIFYEYDWLGEVINNPIKTNADRIRSMSDEELAEFFAHRSPCDYYCNYRGKSCIGISCKKGILEWLKSEMKGIE